jgi:hypothetical protein
LLKINKPTIPSSSPLPPISVKYPMNAYSTIPVESKIAVMAVILAAFSGCTCA